MRFRAGIKQLEHDGVRNRLFGILLQTARPCDLLVHCIFPRFV